MNVKLVGKVSYNLALAAATITVAVDDVATAVVVVLQRLLQRSQKPYIKKLTYCDSRNLHLPT